MNKTILIILTFTIVASLLVAATPFGVMQSEGTEKPKTKEVNWGEPSMEKIFMPPNYSMNQGMNNSNYQVTCRKVRSIWYCWNDTSKTPNGEPRKWRIHWRYIY